jgi:hypothetical protein
VTTGLLRRPDAAFRAMSDDTARNQVNHAQVERGRQAPEHFEDTSPVAPAVKNIDRSVEFLDLVTACHAFVATAGRVVPGMRDRQLGDDERVIVHETSPWSARRWTGSRRPRTPARSTSTGSSPNSRKASSWPRASKRRSPADQRHADTVRFVLFEGRPAGLTFPQLVRSSELSPHQTRSGLACLRDRCCQRNTRRGR